MDAAQCLTLAVTRRGNEISIKIRGDLDLASSTKLLQAVENATDERVRRCVLDCEEVTFIDSEAVKSLLDLSARYSYAERELRLGKCSKQVARLITLLGVEERLPLTEGEPEARI